MIEVTEYRRGRGVIHLGDRVRIRPTPGRRNGFDAIVQRIRIDETTGDVREVDVFGGSRGRAMSGRSAPTASSGSHGTVASTGRRDGHRPADDARRSR
jgi:hypothetical protein